MHEGKTILVTGASGFLGGHVVAALRARGYPVRALVRQVPQSSSWGTDPGVTAVQGDVLDTDSLAQAMEGVWGVVHTAAVVSFYKPMRGLLKQVNHHGTTHVVNCALEAGVQRLIYVSSIGALGPPDADGILHEGCKCTREGDTSWYGYTKHLGELEVQRGVAEGLPALICNPSVIVGPGNWQRSSPALVRAVARGLRFYPTGGNGFVGVWDVAQACCLLLAHPTAEGQRFVLNGENLSFHQFFSLLAEALGKRPPGIAVPTWLGKTVGWLSERKADLLGGEPLLTRETAASSGRTRRFSARKFIDTFDYTFEPMAHVIAKTAKAYTYGNPS